MTSTEDKLRDYLKLVTGDLRQTRERLRAVEASRTEPIAIVGMACRYAGGADTPEQLWELLAKGVDAVSEPPANRGWDMDAIYHPDPDHPGTTYVRHGAFLADAPGFDAGFFGISPREALAMDPQQRLLLEVTWEAVERAGINPHTLRGSATGTFVGGYDSHYKAVIGSHQQSEGHAITGISPSVLSGRVAYQLGLEGPAVTVDTACSSSLVALHLATQALRGGECELALAGGVTVMSTPAAFIEFSRQRGLAVDGRCKAFADAADGMGWGEGVGVLVLERLSDARRNRHRVLAVIRGSAINSDGASSGLTAPNGPSQQRVIRAALTDARLTPAQVDAVEAHGTGTRLGDPIEAQALLATYGAERDGDQPLLLGSVKSNIGHAQAAAGVAGVIKMVLAVQHGLLPRTLHVDRPTTHVDWSSGGLSLLTEARPWPQTGRPRRAGVSAFGISGTNAHLIIEQAPEPPEAPEPAQPTPQTAGTLPLVLSARTPEALRASAAAVKSTMESGAAALDVAYSLATGRASFEHRAVVVSSDRDTAVAGLTAVAAGRTDPAVATGTDLGGLTAMLFSGQGTQRLGMARELHQRFGVFAHAFDQIVERFDGLRDVMWGSDAGALNRTGWAQPALFAVEVALYRLAESWGLVPDLVAGHSIGEIAAAHVAGVFDLPDACTLVAARAKLMQALPGGGAMVAVEATEEEIASRLPATVSIAAINGRTSVVIAGDEDATLTVAAEFTAQGRRTHRLPVSHAFHSVLMEPMLAEFRAAIGDLHFAAPRIPVVSNLTGKLGTDFSAEYWVRHVRNTVRFADGVDTLLAEGVRRFVELGPDGALSAMVLEAAAGHAEPAGVVALPLLRKDRPEEPTAVAALAALHAADAPLDGAGFFAGLGATVVDLPTYPFQHTDFWPDVRSEEPVDVADSRFWSLVDGGPDSFAAALELTGDTAAEVVPALTTWRDRLRSNSTMDSWRYRIEWSPVRLPAGTRLAGTWLVARPEGDSALADGVVTALRAAGAEVRELTGGDLVEVGAPAGVLSLLGLDERPIPGFDAVPAGLAGTVRLLRGLAEAGVTAPVWAVTSGAVSAGQRDGVTHPVQAALWGLGRVAALEQPQRWGGLIDLPDAMDERAAAGLVAALSGATGEDQIAVRPWGLFGRRLVHAPVGEAPLSFRLHGTVLVTGGTGGLGASVARWAASAGAQHLVLLSRRGTEAPGADELRAELTAIGARVTITACDVADRHALAAVLDPITDLTAVLHTAGVVDGDSDVAALSVEQLDRMLRAKLAAARNLHELTEGRPLEAFVLFASAAGIWGSAGMAGYSAANAYLEALADHRAANGLPATSIAWGTWAGYGMGHDFHQTSLRLQRLGVRELDPTLAITVLHRSLQDGRTNLVVADMDWATFVGGFTAGRPSPLLSGLPEARAATAGPDTTAPAGVLAGLAGAELEGAALSLVLGEVASVLGYADVDAVSPDRAFRDLGFDSLTAVELRNRLAQATGLRLPATLIFDYPTAAVLAGHLRAALSGDTAVTTVAAGPAATGDDPVVIVGMGCRYPGGVGSPDDLWRLVADGRDGITPFPDDRNWDLAALAAGASATMSGGFLADVAGFDAAFFGISPREALAMDPQQRLLLETAWHSLDAAGIDPLSLRGSRTGVFVGTNGQSYGEILRGSEEDTDGHAGIGSAASVLSGRLSYVLGLEGPAVTVDTACSSSLVAMHLAARALRDEECALAVAGGVTVMATPGAFVDFSIQGGLAADGRCKAFADAADGTGWSEGVGLLVLERQSDAVRNGHRILAVLRGSAVNQDGASNGLTAPNGPSQQRVIRAALASAGLSTSDVDVVEGHGTGTELGDPIEAQALLATYGQGRKSPLLLGSVKSNIGHAQAAAGVAGVIKMVQAMAHGVVPPTLHVDRPSTHVDWSAGAVELVTETTPWPATHRPRRAAVSSFGVSGTNAHIILEQAPDQPEPAPAVPEDVTAWVASARSIAALDARLAQLRSLSGVSTVDVAAALAGRSLFEHRAVLLAGPDGMLTEAGRGTAGPRTLAVLFSGQGAQRPGMAREMYRRFPVFAQAFDEIVAELDPLLEGSLREVVWGEDAEELNQTGWAQPALFAVEVALYRLAESLGITADYVGGHSIGEVSAAHVAGVLSRSDACRLVAARARLMQALPTGGAMVAVQASEAEIVPLLTDGVTIAAINGPTSVVLAGVADEVLAVQAQLPERRHTRLRVSHAFHSPLMDPMLPDFRAAIAGLTFHEPRIPLLSNVTGTLAGAEVATPDYWVRHVRESVRFADGVTTLLDRGVDTVLELGPDGVLAGAVQDCLGDRRALVVPLLRKDREEPVAALTALARLHVAGVDVDWRALYAGTGAGRVELPGYPFQRERFWPSPAPLAAVDAADAEFWQAVQGNDVGALASALELDHDTVATVVPALSSWRERRRAHRAVESLRYHESWALLPDAAPATGRWLVVAPDGDSWAGRLAGAVDAVRVAGTAEDLRAHDTGAAGVLAVLTEPAQIAALLRELDAAGSTLPVWVATHDAVPVDTGDLDLDQAGVWGAGRVAALEYPQRWGGLIDLPADLTGPVLESFVSALGRTDGEDQLAVRASGVYGRRLVPAGPTTATEPWRPTGSVLITGGTGALGSQVARWLAARGAEHLVLLSRRGPAADGAEELRAELLDAGAESVTIAACDAADADQVRQVLAAIPARYPLTGVVHAAGIVDDAVLNSLTPERFAAMHRAKVAGALVLDELTRDADLTAFVLFSSTAAAIGNLGQASYAAANAQLDALAVRRRAAGLPATAIAWGPWAGAGMAADQRYRHLPALAPDIALAVLGTVVAEPAPTVVAVDLADTGLLTQWLERRPSALLRGLPAAAAILATARSARREADSDGAGLRQRLRSLPADERFTVLLGLLRARIAAVLGHASVASVETDKAFRDLGFDSLTAVELRNQLAELTGLALPAGLVFDFPTARRLTEHLLAELLGEPADTAPVRQAAADEPIAIVGMACRFPSGIDTPEDLWRLLESGGDAIGAFPADRGWDLDALFDGDADGNGRSQTREGGFLADVAGFDAGFFGISPREAVTMDPQQRLLLETVWETFERAGIDPNLVRGTRTGVFMGTNGQDYLSLVLADRDAGDGHATTGVAASVIAGRIAYTFGLEGPALTVDTACSSSLVAMHLAAESLRRGECDLALAGGATTMTTPGTFVELSRQGALSPDGRCKAFSEAADGTGFSEGVGVLLLEPLSKAQQAGHPILAVLRGSAINQDGASNGLTAPNGQAQQRVIRDALAAAGLSTSDIDVVEAHGTGTRLGDPIEAEALLATYGRDREAPDPLWLGSVKSNLGHTQAAAGVAGVMKMVLAMQHRTIPRTLHVAELSSHVDWSGGAVSVLTEPVPWGTGSRPMRAAVSSFGISGTNAHTILEQAPDEPCVAAEPVGEPAALPFLLSAKSAPALRAQAAALLSYVDSNDVGLAELARALRNTRAAFDHRAVVVAGDRDELRARLAGLAGGDQPAGVAVAQAAPAEEAGKIAFVFPGQGSQWAGMAVELLDQYPVFAEQIRRCEQALAPHLDWSVTDVLRGSPGAPSIERIEVVQPVLFAVMVSLAAVWRSFGVHPDFVIGTSQGEVAAACVAGALTVEDAARVIALRSKVLAAELVGKGALASLAVSEQAAAERIAKWGGRLSIGGVNAPALVTVAGDEEALAELAAECEADGVRLRMVAASVPTHCALVDPLRAELLEVLRGITPTEPAIPVYSTVTGRRLAPGELMADEYWYDNTRAPVLFSQATERLFEDGCGTFLEMSPHPVMSFAIEGTSAALGRRPVVLGSLRRGDGGLARLLVSVGDAYAHGTPVDWTAFLGDGTSRRLDLPTYRFQHERYWPATDGAADTAAGGELDGEFWDAVERNDLAALAAGLQLGTDTMAEVLPALRGWRSRRHDQSRIDQLRYRVAWRPVGGLADQAPTGEWLLVTAAGTDGTDVHDALTARGVAVRRLELDDSCTDRAVLAQRLAGAETVSGVVSLLALAQAPSERFPALAEGLALTITLIQALGDKDINAPLWCLTRGAVSTGRTDALTNPLQAQVLGVGWTAALEHPHRWGGVIDLPSTLDEPAGRALTAVLAGGTGEDQLAIRSSGVLARRVVRAPASGRAPARPWSPRGTILVTGGTGQIGPHLVRWLVEQGAQDIVLTSRSGAGAALAAEFDGIVTLATCDVADREALAALLDRLRAEGRRIRTVVHAAAVIELAYLADTSLDHFGTVVNAKVAGARNLDELLADEDLDAFVLYSSNAGMWGSGEHGAYVAGNAYLAALAANRRARGLVATALHWGKWPDNRDLFDGAEDPFGVRRGGLEFLDEQLALAGMRRALDDDETVLALTGVNWERYFPVFTSGRPTTLFDEIGEVRALVEAQRRADAGADEAEFVARLRAMPPGEQPQYLLNLVRSEAATVLGHSSAEALPERRAFRDVGFDSVTAVDLRNRLAAATGVPLPATLVFDYPNPAALAEFLRTEVLGAAEPAAAVAAETGGREEPVAVIGMACRFPGGVSTPEDLWRLVVDGVDAITEYPRDRGWDLDARYDPDRGRQGHTYATSGGFLSDVAGFDPGFFGISPREAVSMDPQQRLLLEVAWEAVERAGIDMSTLRGSATGIFVGGVYPDYGAMAPDDGAETHMVTGAAPSILSGRLAYLFGLEGPAVTLDTGCSSSLVALHLACQSLRSGESSLALAGGVTVMSSPAEFFGFSRLGALAPDGRCKAFGDAADGMGLSEGVGVLLVERLSDALANGHPVLAVVRGSAMNQDGASNGLTAPSGPSQQRVIRQALANAGLSPSDVDAVEAHGTGTTLGDPIEAQALMATYGKDRRTPLMLGSVKSNIGHTQMASGAASLIKMVQALQHGVLPRTLHVDPPTTHVDWTAGGIELLGEQRDWPATDRPRRAGVSSFGISGTNVHVILEQAPQPVPAEPAAPAGGPVAGPVPWLVSGRSESALRGQAARLVDRIARDDPDPVDVGWSLLTGRQTFEHRAVVLGSGTDELAAGLRALADGTAATGVVRGAAVDGSTAPVFVFPGQGSQWWGMGRELLATSDVFRTTIAACADALAPHVDWSLPEVVAGLGDEDLLSRVDVVQPALWAMMVSLVELWRSYGVTPAAVVGHSQGEIAAAYVAGALSLDDSAAVVALRSKALVRLCGQGGMVSVAEPLERVRELLAPWHEVLSVAAVNGPRSVVVSGPAEALDELLAHCAEAGARARRVAVDYASHSAQMDLIRDELAELLAGITPRPATVPFYSTVTGAKLDTTALDAGYWFTNLRQTVLLDRAVSALLDDGYRVFVESSPHPVLMAGVQETLEEHGAPAATIGTLRRNDGGTARVLTSLAEAHVHGVPVDWSVCFAGTGARRIDLPTYAFQRRRYWWDTTAAPVAPAGTAAADEAFWELVSAGDLASLAAALEVDAPTAQQVAPGLANWLERSRNRSTVDGWRYRVEWATVAEPAGRPTGRWLVVVPDRSGDWAEAVLAALGEAAVPVEVTGYDRTSLADRLSSVDTAPPAGVLSLLALRQEPCPDAQAVPQGLAATVALLQALGDAAIDAPLWCVTTGAVATGATDRLSHPVQAAVWGLGRVAALEQPTRWGGLVDLPDRPDATAVRRLLGILAGAGGEDQLAVRPAGVFGARLSHAPSRPAVPGRTWRPTGTVLITGGTGGVGGELARWAAASGAEHLLLASRRGPAAPGARELAEALRATGTRVTVRACDLSDRTAVADLLTAVPAEAPLTAVLHAAGVVDGDREVAELSTAELDLLLGAKMASAWHLHELTKDMDLSAFVLFASGAGVWGSGGQPAYAAANAFLDALARYRRDAGLTATSIAWGTWAEAGKAASSEVTEQLRRRGVMPMRPALAISALQGAIEDDLTGLTVTDMDWTRFVPSFTVARPSPLIADLPEVRAVTAPAAGADEPATDQAALRQRLAGLSTVERERVLLELVRAEAGAVLGFAAGETLPAGKPFRDFGLDSVTAVELRNRLKAATGLTLPGALVFDYPNPGALARHLLGELYPDGATAPTDDPDAEVRGLLASIPIGRLRRAGLLDMVLRLAREDEPGPAGTTDTATADSLDDLDDLDGESLLRLAAGNTDNQPEM